MKVKINVENKNPNKKEESIPEIKSMLDASHMKGHEPDSLRDILNDTVSYDEFIKEKDGKYKDIFDYAYDECGKHVQCDGSCILWGGFHYICPYYCEYHPEEKVPIGLYREVIKNNPRPNPSGIVIPMRKHATDERILGTLREMRDIINKLLEEKEKVNE